MLEKLTGFHIEPTNVCTLKCPGCARTKFIEQFPRAWRNQHLNLSDLDQFMDVDLDDKDFVLCGNDGDPIYYNQLFEMIKWAHQRGANVHITTNGSYRSAKWWKTLSELLKERDSITFSVDGLPENFTQYRINAEWTSIELGMSIMRDSMAKTRWKYIPFSFNEQDIDQAYTIAQNLGIDQFIVSPSDRWDNTTEELRPRNFTGAREQTISVWSKNKNIEIIPKCKKMNNQHYISSSGFYMPCCFVGDYRFYYKSEFYRNKSQYDISKTTLSTILLVTQSFYDNIEQSQLEYCTYNCPKL
jgi:MoaA/NifB/PqqE/SkfB family radical SAM enzyme